MPLRLLRIFVTFWLMFLIFRPAAGYAQTCNFVITNINFGVVDTLGGSAADVAGTISITCSGLLFSANGRVNVAAGSGGATAGGRRMTGGSTDLVYQLYKNAARTQVLGSDYWSFGGSPISFSSATLNLLGATASINFYGRVFGAQSTVQPLAYSSSFNASSVVIDYRTCVAIILCVDRVASASFLVSGQVLAQCMVNASDIDFGAVGVLSSDIDASGDLDVTCTPTTDYAIGLNHGLSGTGPTARNMTWSGRAVTYGLYQDAGASTPWGDGSSAVSGTGTGAQQNFTVHGRVPPQTTPPSGFYSDTISVSVVY